MLAESLIPFALILPVAVHCVCYSNTSETWTCDDQSKHFNLDYQHILNNEQLENLFLKNYYSTILILDNYPSTLRLLNASNNRFQTIVITKTNRYRSNLRQLILESNDIRLFDRHKVHLPHSLEVISLANNHIEIIDGRIFFHLNKLVTLDLRNNQLKRISPDLLPRMSINLDNNPLDCQCTPEDYRIICEKSTNLKQSFNESNNCRAPYYDSQKDTTRSASFLRFSKLTLVCPISAHPPPMILWSTPFGNLTSLNSSQLDLLLSNDDAPMYIALKSIMGPLTARTRHRLRAFDANYLSITMARAALRNRFSCSGINMLGTYTHKFEFNVHTRAQKNALWLMLFTAIFGLVMSLIGGLLCIILKCTYYSHDNMKTPPMYPTLATSSVSHTPPNAEYSQWLSTAAANMTETLEQVRDKLRSGVVQVSGRFRHAVDATNTRLHSIRETSQHRFNAIRVHTSSSLRSSGQFMRSGMHLITSQVNSLRDYCGITTGHLVSTNYLLQQQQQTNNVQPSTSPIFHMHHRQMTAIMEGNEFTNESNSSTDVKSYIGCIPTPVLMNKSIIGILETADNSVIQALDNFSQDTIDESCGTHGTTPGYMVGGIGAFHDRSDDPDDKIVNESQRLIVYGEQRRVC